MNMIYLPYAEDLKTPDPQRDSNLMGKVQHAAPNEVQAAGRLADALLDDGDFEAGQIPNPQLQRFFQACCLLLGHSCLTPCLLQN